jgi:hypothetical protein
MKPGALSTRCARRRKAATSASDSDAATRSRDIETYMARERYRREVDEADRAAVAAGEQDEVGIRIAEVPGRVREHVPRRLERADRERERDLR